MTTIGQPVSRYDGRLKVTGAAAYTADIFLPGATHGAIVQSTIANGRAVSIDTAAAERAPGVVAVFTYRNMPRMKSTPRPWSHLHPHGQSYLPLQDDNIHYAGQPIALIIAETLDQAAHAGTLIEVSYETRDPVLFGPKMVKEAVDPPQFLWPVSSSVGNAEKGIADGSIRLEQTYTTSDRHHNQMEPHATTAVWASDGTLTLYETTQHIFGARELISIVLGMPLEKIIVVSQFIGGGFGGKAYVWPHTLLTALAAKAVDRPVRLQLTRAQMYSMVGHQSATVQTIAVGARENGKLTGIRHESVSATSVFDDYIEYAALSTRSLWAVSGGISTNHKIVHANRNTPTAMRSPHEALGHFALESAMDELAYASGVDPVALRLVNDAELDPHSGRPYSSRAMRECLMEGAARFGWDKRSPKPRSMRDGRHLIGQGMAGAIYTHWRWPAEARVIILADGTALVETGSHDLGTGTYTVMRQIAADGLGISLDKVSVRLGDTRLPASHASIGSATMANAGASVMLAAQAARNKAIELALSGRDAPLAGAVAKEVTLADGFISAAARNVKVSYAELLARSGLSELVGEGKYDPVEEANGPKAIFSFAAVFAEVRVDPELGVVRLNRLVGAYDAGRIVNPKTARSQAIGGIIWGVGQALMEQSEMDQVLGRFLNRNYSGYLVPTNADIPELETLFVGEFDEEASPLGAKGLGELTAVSVAPAIANAVYHAIGKRIRDLPITIEKLL
ncbi:xanthine dehydrogenase family protein molybdopterin-binding subunit [Bradyrhizobium sp. Ash2021]|uniref:xanthine dehydrogenase family protein molybdopterin-binding subunit n=1 Tax=Bradyrhizobium sp. Ash2021 TaxID=2954771 RepID=UPI00281653D2|nr:xanthine dehydrogenase family protein molybdopterin-binding subunit [Bradyrhizobium sp. Ash2021]WMT76379.1 xanthine dehydrogenase family protein molybdopterin-binding subunit [Bradyrhizobium sp. Ash2021]